MYETEKWLVYEHDDFYEDMGVLVKKLVEYQRQPEQSLLFTRRRFDGVYGIPAGGLILAVHLHYRLKLPLLLAPTPDSLVVDDIVDNGLTMSHYIAKGIFTVSLFYRENGIWKPDLWLHEKQDKWIHFPWEAPEDGDDRLE